MKLLIKIKVVFLIGNLENVNLNKDVQVTMTANYSATLRKEHKEKRGIKEQRKGGKKMK